MIHALKLSLNIYNKGGETQALCWFVLEGGRVNEWDNGWDTE